MPQAAARSSFLALIALAFGFSAFRYPIGALDRPGPGLFPLAVSAALLVLSATMLLLSVGRTGERLKVPGRNIVILVAALGGFVIASHVLDVAAGIGVLVFTAGLAARTWSLVRSTVLAVALVLVALGFERLLGLRLGVF